MNIDRYCNIFILVYKFMVEVLAELQNSQTISSGKSLFHVNNCTCLIDLNFNKIDIYIFIR